MTFQIKSKKYSLYAIIYYKDFEIITMFQKIDVIVLQLYFLFYFFILYFNLTI